MKYHVQIIVSWLMAAYSYLRGTSVIIIMLSCQWFGTWQWNISYLSQEITYLHAFCNFWISKVSDTLGGKPLLFRECCLLSIFTIFFNFFILFSSDTNSFIEFLECWNDNKFDEKNQIKSQIEPFFLIFELTFEMIKFSYNDEFLSIRVVIFGGYLK